MLPSGSVAPGSSIARALRDKGILFGVLFGGTGNAQGRETTHAESEHRQSRGSGTLRFSSLSAVGLLEYDYVFPSSLLRDLLLVQGSMGVTSVRKVNAKHTIDTAGLRPMVIGSPNLRSRS